VAARGQSPFCFAKKVTQKGDPGDSLISCGARVRRASHKSPDGALTARGGLMVRRLDRLPLRSSERIHGDPVKRMLDRFAIGLRVRILVRLRDALALGTRLTRASLRRMRGLGFLRGLRGLCLI